jgi:hypothetical protein
MNRRVAKSFIGLGSALALLFVLALVAQAASPSGAIFTTTPDGGIVNENVRYTSKP